MTQTQPHVSAKVAAVFFEGHLHVRVLEQTYRLDYVPVPLSEGDAKTPLKKGSRLGYELTRALCRELRATVESESAFSYLSCGQSTDVMTKLRAAAEAERSACYARLNTLRVVAIDLFQPA